jgi:hypothetical protein
MFSWGVVEVIPGIYAPESVFSIYCKSYLKSYIFLVLMGVVLYRNFIGSITRLNSSFSANELPEMYVSGATLPQQRNCVRVQTDLNRELTDYG